jgi:hypothetical protein
LVKNILLLLSLHYGSRDLPSSFKFSLIMTIQPVVVMWWPVSLSFGDPIEAQVRMAVGVVWAAML